MPRSTDSTPSRRRHSGTVNNASAASGVAPSGRNEGASGSSNSGPDRELVARMRAWLDSGRLTSEEAASVFESLARLERIAVLTACVECGIAVCERAIAKTEAAEVTGGTEAAEAALDTGTREAGVLAAQVLDLAEAWRLEESDPYLVAGDDPNCFGTVRNRRRAI